MDTPTPTRPSASSAEATMTSEEFLSRSSSWTLACDNALLNRLKNFSDNISKQSQGILEDCDNLSTQIDLLNTKVQTVTNQFLMLSSTQFVENRVEEFQETLEPNRTTQSVPVKTKTEKEAELISKMKEAIQIGVAVKAKEEVKRNAASEESISSAHPVKLKLSHIIGTPKFFSNRYCGLVDEMQDVPHKKEPATVSAIPTEVYVSEPEPKSFSVNVNDIGGDDLFFPTRELYRPPSINQSLYKEGSPSSDDTFIHGTASTATSSSNIAQGVDNQYGSDTSSLSDTKPKSILDELNRTLRSRAPPAAVGNDSSDEDFRPMAPGKGIRSTLFADDDDDDIFGENSLFRAKESDNDDLFFDKPPAPVPNIFGYNNPRSPPDKDIAVAPPIATKLQQSSQQPLPDPVPSARLPSPTILTQDKRDSKVGKLQDPTPEPFTTDNKELRQKERALKNETDFKQPSANVNPAISAMAKILTQTQNAPKIKTVNDSTQPSSNPEPLATTTTQLPTQNESVSKNETINDFKKPSTKVNPAISAMAKILTQKQNASKIKKVEDSTQPFTIPKPSTPATTKVIPAQKKIISKLKNAKSVFEDSDSDDDLFSSSSKVKKPEVTVPSTFLTKNPLSSPALASDSGIKSAPVPKMAIQSSTNAESNEKKPEVVLEQGISKPEPKSFNMNNDKCGDDLFFPTRELHRPPSINQSIYKEVSPSSDDAFISGTASTATSSSNNIPQGSDKQYESDTSSSSDKKPKSILGELNRTLRSRAPPAAVGIDSSGDHFQPLAPGKEVRNTLFADDDDEDIFGKNSLFQAKESDNDDLFFDKPPAPAPSIFSYNNVRSPPDKDMKISSSIKTIPPPKTIVSKFGNAKSLFEDTDSDDDLFTPSSKVKKTEVKVNDLTPVSAPAPSTFLNKNPLYSPAPASDIDIKFASVPKIQDAMAIQPSTNTEPNEKKPEVVLEQGISFEDSTNSQNLLPSVTKSRAKVLQKRRPPSRKPLHQVPEGKSENGNSLADSGEVILSSPPPVDDDEDNDATASWEIGRSRVDIFGDSSSED